MVCLRFVAQVQVQRNESSSSLAIRCHSCQGTFEWLQHMLLYSEVPGFLILKNTM
jgi:hypothetical protein